MKQALKPRQTFITEFFDLGELRHYTDRNDERREDKNVCGRPTNSSDDSLLENMLENARGNFESSPQGKSYSITVKMGSWVDCDIPVLPSSLNFICVFS